MKSFKSSEEFLQVTEKSINSLIELLTSKTTEFSIITKPQYITLDPYIPDLFRDDSEYVKFDIVGYSFETSMVVDNRFIFRAGFGDGMDIKESEVSLDILHIFQLFVGDEVLFMNFSQPPEVRSRTKKDRSNIFLNKNRNLFKK
jgi:hypothetical protein